MGTKTDPGDYDCYAKAAEDEPIFVLRASDPLSPKLVRKWVSMSIETTKHNDKFIKKWMEAMNVATEMEFWKHNEKSRVQAAKPSEPESDSLIMQYVCTVKRCNKLFTELPENHVKAMGFYCAEHADQYEAIPEANNESERI